MELRAVVFGGKFSGKTLLINAVFGKEVPLDQKRTANCKKHQGTVSGRELTLVDTPGWWKHFPLSDTATFLKKELIQGVSLCCPGPHAIVLAIEIDIPFTEKHRKAAEDHLGLLGDQIWTYVLVVFTRSLSLRDRTIEQHIEKEGEPLQWIIKKCGNRYCEFESRVLNNTSQVKQMLEMIENIVQINNGGYFQIEAKILKEAEEWKSMVTRKANSRKSKLQGQRELDKDELRIALLGWVIAGKSSAGNTILNRQVFVTGQSTVNCNVGHGEVDGRPVTVLDTPSWFKYFPSQYTPPWIKSGILQSVRDTFTSPNCILLVIPGDTSFKEQQRKVIEENMSFLGEQVWKHTIVLFTWGDILGDLSIEQHIESEGDALQWVIDKCENRYHVFDNEERENRVQVMELLQKIDEMMARNIFFSAPQEEVDTQSESRDTESHLEEIVRYVEEEWRRRDKELLQRISDVADCIKIAAHQYDSRIFPLKLGETSPDNETEDHSEKQESDELLKRLSKMMKYIKSTCTKSPESTDLPRHCVERIPLELPKHIKDMLDQEWSRREEALMGRLQEMLGDIRRVHEASSTTKPEGHSKKPVSLTEDVPKRFLCEKEVLPKSDSSMDHSLDCEFLQQPQRELESCIREASSTTKPDGHSKKPLTEDVPKKVFREKEALPKSDTSMDFPPYFSETSVSTKSEDHSEKQQPQTELESCTHDGDERSIKLKESIKEMLDRDWSRQDEALMGRVLEMLCDIFEAQSEPNELRKRRSRERVLDWLRGQSLGYSADSELRAVVFGGKFSGKTLLINAVFGKEVPLDQKRTAHCKKHQGTVSGRELTLVDTPGWWKHFLLSDTATFLKKELIQGVSLCCPGPHAIVLAIDIDIPFTEKHRKAAEDHLGLLGDQIWTYVLVVFTRSLSLRDRTIEQHIEKEGEPLQWIIKKCGNRYCEFESRVLNNTSQVKQMLEMIENIVQINNGGYFQIEAKILKEAEEWKSMVTRKANSRKSKLQGQRELDKDELRIALLGWVIAGKSSAGNTILNRQVFVTGQSTVNCNVGHGEVDGRPVTVLDTPSWFKYFPSQYTPPWIKSGILQSIRDTFTSPNCILLVIPGDTSFKEQQRKVIEENMSFLGEQVWKHTIVLFTWGDILGDLSIEQHIESEGDALQWVIDKCENRYHVFDNEERENRVQVMELLQKIDEMMAKNSFFSAPQEEEDTQSESRDTESDLEEIVRYVEEEWRRRDKELLQRISDVTECIKVAAHQYDSRIFPLKLGETGPDSETEDHSEKQESETDELLKRLSKMMKYIKATCTKSPESTDLFRHCVERRPLELPKHIKDMLDREWSRREEALMGRLQEMLGDIRRVGEASSTTKPEGHSKKPVPLTEDVPKKVFCEKKALPKSDSSMEFPLDLSKTSVSTKSEDHSEKQQPQPELESCTHDGDERSIKLKESIKEMLDRDWSRRDEALMGRVLEMFCDIFETQSEPNELRKRRSRERVLDWLRGQTLGYSADSGKGQSDT